MSGGKGGGSVDVPDFEKLLKLQAQLNRINVNSPFGTVRFTSGDPGRRRLPPGVRKSTPTPSPDLPPGVTSSFRGGPGVGGGGGGTGGGGTGGTGGGGGPAGGGGDFRNRAITSTQNQEFLDFLRPLTDPNFVPPTNGGGGGTGVPNTATITLSPDQQKILDLKEQGQKRLGRTVRDLARGLRDLPGFTTDFSGDREKVEQALFSRGQRLLDPVFERQDRALEQRLANRGIPLGSEAFGDAFDQFGQRRNQAFLDLADRSILAGGQEQSRQFANLLAQRGQAFNEVLGGLAGQQIQSPTIFPPGGIDVLGSQGLVQQAQSANSQLGLQQQAGLFGGLSSLLGGVGLLGLGGII